MRWFDLPAAISRSTSNSRSVSGSARPGGAAAARPRRHGTGLAAGAHEHGQVAGVDAASRVLLVRLGSGQLGEQGVHRRALVGEDADIAMPAGEGERLGQRAEGAGLIAAGGQRERSQRLYLNDAVSTVLAGRGVE